MIDINTIKIEVGDIIRCIPGFTNDNDSGGVGYIEGKEFEVGTVNLYGGEDDVFFPVLDGKGVRRRAVELVQKRNQKEALEKILNKIYGDNWEIKTLSDFKKDFPYSVFEDSTSSFVLTIRYDKIIIKNTNNEKHTIYDLFVCILLNSDFTPYDSNIYGFRTSKTQIEYNKCYNHSHLSVDEILKIRKFCTGAGVIDDYLVITKGLDIIKNELTFETLFETLNSYLEWESLEGGPYIRISELYSVNNSIYTPSKIVIKKLLTVFKQFNVNLPILITSNKEININEDKLLSIIISLIKENKNKELALFLVGFLKENNLYFGNYLSNDKLLDIVKDITDVNTTNNIPEPSNTIEFTIINENSGFIFKNKEIPVLLIKEQVNKTKININNVLLIPSLVQELNKMMSTHFQKSYITLQDEYIKQLTSNSEIK